MDLTGTFETLVERTDKWVKQLDAAADSENDDLDIAQMSEEQKNFNQKFRFGMDELSKQFEASRQAAEAMAALFNALQRYIKQRAFRGDSTFYVRLGRLRSPRNNYDTKLQQLTQLTDTVKETLQLLEDARTTLSNTIDEIKRASQLSDEALDALAEAKQREEEERKRREDEEREAREQQRREEEKRRKEEEERERQEEEELRRVREEEEQKKREEEQKKREEEQKKREEERKKREEEERQKREEEERKEREEAERIRKIEEERQRQEEEERRIKKEEEERKRAEERRRRREMKERRRREKEEEEQREREAVQLRLQKLEEDRFLREAQRRWPAILVVVMNSELHSKHGCAIRAPEGSLISDEFQCTIAPELIKFDSFAASEQVVGNAIRLEAKGRSELGITFRGRRVEWLVSLPHCAQRTPGRETVLYMHKNDSWHELPTSDIQLESLPSEHSWVEARISEPSVTLVPVSRWKINRFSLPKEGMELVSQVDNRIRLNIPPESFTVRNAMVEQTFEARPIAASVIENLRNTRPEYFSELVATSALVTHSSSAGQTVPMPMTYTLHVPRNSQKQTAAFPANSQHSVPISAGSKNHSSLAAANPDITIIANIESNASDAHWTALEKIVADETTAQEKLAVKFRSLTNRKLLALRVTQDFDLSKLDPVCREIEAAIDTQIACLIVGQSRNSRQALVALPSVENAQNVLDKIKAMDFRHICPPGDADTATTKLRVKERQELRIDFTGNVSSKDGDRFTVMFHSQLCSFRLLTLIPKDPFLQTSLQQFRGFVQVFSEFQPTQLAKLPLQLTKLPSDRGSGPAWKTTFKYNSRDAVTKKYLQSLASRLAGNWPILADALGLSKERCSAIKNNGGNASDQALEMLIDWLKGTPYSMRKAPVLAKALRSAGYSQLSVELHQRQTHFQEVNDDSTSDTE